MENTFEVGQVVRLKSGGPAMTVGEIKDGLAFLVASYPADEPLAALEHDSSNSRPMHL